MYAPTQVRVHEDADYSDMRLLVLLREEGRDLPEADRIVVARYHQSVPVADVAAHLAASWGNVEVVGGEADAAAVAEEARRAAVACAVQACARRSR